MRPTSTLLGLVDTFLFKSDWMIPLETIQSLNPHESRILAKVTCLDQTKTHLYECTVTEKILAEMFSDLQKVQSSFSLDMFLTVTRKALTHSTISSNEKEQGIGVECAITASADNNSCQLVWYNLEDEDDDIKIKLGCLNFELLSSSPAVANEFYLACFNHSLALQANQERFLKTIKSLETQRDNIAQLHDDWLKNKKEAFENKYMKIFKDTLNAKKRKIRELRLLSEKLDNEANALKHEIEELKSKNNNGIEFEEDRSPRRRDRSESPIWPNKKTRTSPSPSVDLTSSLESATGAHGTTSKSSTNTMSFFPPRPDRIDVTLTLPSSHMNEESNRRPKASTARPAVAVSSQSDMNDELDADDLMASLL